MEGFEKKRAVNITGSCTKVIYLFFFFLWIVYSKYFSTASEVGTTSQEEKMQGCSLVLFQSRLRGDPAAGSAAHKAWWLSHSKYGRKH